jgi:hypothetical protein
LDTSVSHLLRSEKVSAVRLHHLPCPESHYQNISRRLIISGLSLLSASYAEHESSGLPLLQTQLQHMTSWLLVLVVIPHSSLFISTCQKSPFAPRLPVSNLQYTLDLGSIGRVTRSSREEWILVSSYIGRAVCQQRRLGCVLQSIYYCFKIHTIL